MATASSIEWTDVTWNPVTGCSKISPGCKFCYAERMAKRLFWMGQDRYKNGFKVTLQPAALEEPRRWKKGRLVFVNSMSDLFHHDVPDTFIRAVFKTMNECPQHQFQILTKRSERMASISKTLTWTQNIWAGVSVENERYRHRTNDLRKVPAHIRFLSVEPLLGPIKTLNLRNIDWVIVGGESGPGAREVRQDWVRDLRNLCVSMGIPFFFKQWGGVRKGKSGRLLDGREWNEFPNYHRMADQMGGPGSC